ncbi:NADP-dependent phosphogluconate dehydrogenase [Sulfitobacter pseudonitzschiae]|uniref:6-phosphogluconate dehydrogenase, decarboxylating n=1 Tax=Pseudosulfitobacter pseudonitzschiae TaxID=1402135 RepID=A0A9Q2NSC1_9RHOB|nr:NADP-dependent phosphogluconate dehydrogenase [Pseudosulfitobacter pseudonitzschiae]MBM2291619.1 NADP-dependent phosphogluconate dehydrogenase [Pseudosulfitobacter pseudonitzschiae]MBM2296537.1 NADP-dependent phosphogluconate dehydrogenase [Pseudosulfitobacter pseudonitzschiae]MBM2301450.1 NADP-dependent phosphogluconate dehydrogenase [Pseudosulfitobacter pseudonitzschiae]MBM2311234.1 NADP-dependent phosphogluconate dehydrogenase [Pseudosulfitobacter pseudonitzschiae]MBM2316147.1 NADP-depen
MAQQEIRAQIGVYGLGTMGSALALNLADHGFDVAVSNREADWIDAFLPEAAGLSGSVTGHADLTDFVAAIAAPRTILFMIPSTKPMDVMIEAITPLLSEGDTIIDGGNADFNDTRRRSAALDGTGIHFVGMGVSGGEEGARNGPSMMVGGSDHSWAQLKPMAEAIAAKFHGDPCVAHLGPDGAGHFVKTVHNGIEYADMQMIAEIYGMMRDQAGMDAGQIGQVFDGWRAGPLASYLIDITAKALASSDAATGQPIVDVIRDQAGQKGTGRWTLIEALKMGQSASTIEAAVGARGWSSEGDVRRAAQELLDPATQPADIPATDDMENALLAARILGHAQGFRVLSAASDEFNWTLDLARIAEIWRAGCIIRSALLDEFADAVRAGLPKGHLILAPAMRKRLTAALPGLRRVVAAAALSGQPVPALSAALAWHDTMALGRGTANMIQAQRDYFGAHGFERMDQDGAHHGEWLR